SIVASWFIFFFQAEDGIRDFHVTGVQTCALPISDRHVAHLVAVLAQAELDVEVGMGGGHLVVAVLAPAEPAVPRVERGAVGGLRSEERRVGKERRTRWIVGY